MKLKYPCQSFFYTYFTVNSLIYGFFSAIFFSIFIYLEYFNLTHPLMNTIFALSGSFMLLHGNKKQLLIAGFFIGIFWFWWIGLSFRYYDLSYLIPLIIVGLGLIYSVLFFLIGLLHPFLRIFVFSFLSSLSLLGFDWLRTQAVFVDTPFGIDHWQLLVIFFALFLFKYRRYSIVLLLFALEPEYAYTTEDNTIKVMQTAISQEDKWKPKMLPSYGEFVYEQTLLYKEKGFEAVIFPESFLTTYLNKNFLLKQRLKALSKDITIVTGALYKSKQSARNSTYIFQNRQMEIAHKVVLVPFGEANPLPEFLSDFVNKIFFDGAKDYTGAKEFTTFKIDGKVYKNAICYEATDAKLYKDNPQNIIALSNNAWFTPSTQPTLQKLLLKVFVKRLNVTIYHSINAAPSYILTQGKRWHF